MNQESLLLTILADYSNDLATLKKRDGKTPADAAVERITEVIAHSSQEEYLRGRGDGAVEATNLLSRSTQLAALELQMQILRGFRRRDFVRDDFYEIAVINRLSTLQQARDVIRKKK